MYKGIIINRLQNLKHESPKSCLNVLSALSTASPCTFEVKMALCLRRTRCSHHCWTLPDLSVSAYNIPIYLLQWYQVYIQHLHLLCPVFLHSSVPLSISLRIFHHTSALVTHSLLVLKPPLFSDISPLNNLNGSFRLEASQTAMLIRFAAVMKHANGCSFSLSPLGFHWSD